MRKLSFFLAALLASAAASASCGSYAPVVSNDSVTTQGEVTTAPEVEELSLPDDLDLGGMTIRVLNSQDYAGGEAEGDLVYEEIYKRNMKVEEELNVTFEFIDYLGADYQKVPAAVRQSVNAGSDDYDIITCAGRLSLPLVSEGLYTSVNDLPYVELEKPWWATDMLEAISVNASDIRVLTGDITHCFLERLSCAFVNQRLLEEVGGLTNTDLYEIVLNGGWTFDKMSEIGKNAYRDLNGDSQADEADQYMLGHYLTYAFTRSAYSSGLSFTDRDSVGYPVLAVNNERTVSLIETLTDLFIKNENVIQLQTTSTYSSNNRADKILFGAGQTMFMLERFYVAGWDELRNMKDDFCIVPYPKAAADVDTYRTVSDSNTLLFSVPVTAQKLTEISAVLESMAYYGKQMISPVYYETALKIKYTRDDMSSQMIDLITENARTDFLYFNNLNGMGGEDGIFAQVYNNAGEGFSSLYASLEEAAKTGISDIIKALNS